jgi:hypothetical protein
MFCGHRDILLALVVVVDGVHKLLLVLDDLPYRAAQRMARVVWDHGDALAFPWVNSTRTAERVSRESVCYDR